MPLVCRFYDIVNVYFFLLVALQWVLRDLRCHYQDEVFLQGGLTGVSTTAVNIPALCSVSVADTSTNQLGNFCSQYLNGTNPSY